MQLGCDAIADLLPAVLDGGEIAGPRVVAHVEGCLRCQLELARYRRLLRLLGQLRVERPQVPVGLVAQTLGMIEAAATRQAVRSILSRRAVGATIAALGALVAVALASRAQREPLTAHGSDLKALR